MCPKAIGSPKAIDIVPDGDWQPEGMCMPEGSCWLTERGDIELTADPAGADMTAAAGWAVPTAHPQQLRGAGWSPEARAAAQCAANPGCIWWAGSFGS